MHLDKNTHVSQCVTTRDRQPLPSSTEIYLYRISAECSRLSHMHLYTCYLENSVTFYTSSGYWAYRHCISGSAGACLLLPHTAWESALNKLFPTWHQSFKSSIQIWKTPFFVQPLDSPVWSWCQQNWERRLHPFWRSSRSPVSVSQYFRCTETAVHNVSSSNICRSQSSCHHILLNMSSTSPSVLGTAMARSDDDGCKSWDIGEQSQWMGGTYGLAGSRHFLWCGHWSCNKDQNQTGVRGPSVFVQQKWKTIKKCKEMQ